MFHKIKNGLVKINNRNAPKMPTSRITRFQQKNIVIPGSRLQSRYNSFFVRVPKVYAKLQADKIKNLNQRDFEAYIDNNLIEK